MASAQQKRMKSELTELIYTEPFFAFLALRLTMKEDTNTKTAYTDGTTLGFNPEYVASLNNREVRGLIAQLTCYCALGHPWRRQERDPKRFTQACQLAVAGILKKAGFDLPPGCQHRPEFDGLSAEAIYSDLPAPAPPPDGKGKKDGTEPGTDPGQPAPGPGDPGTEPGDGEGDGEGDGAADQPGGEVQDSPPDGSPDQNKAAEWAQAVLQAARHAQAQGKLPAGMERAVTEAKNPPCRDIIAAVMEWAQAHAKDDYSWRRPNPRYIARGLYMPSLYSPQVPRMAAGIDTSASINDDSLALFAGALQRVLDEVKPERITVMACDSRIHTTHEYEQGEEIKETYPGRGGTDFRPVFDALEPDPPVGVLYLTDLDGPFPKEPPEYPVLWVIHDPRARRQRPPFGDAIYLP